MSDDNKKVYVDLFGKLQIRTTYGQITQDDINSPQMCKLIAYLVLNRNSIISTDILTAILWPQGTEDPYMSLRGLVFRLRKILKPVFPEESFVVAKNGSYIINNFYSLSVDAEQLSVISKYTVSSIAAKKFLDTHCQPFMEILASDIWGLPVCTFYNSRMITYTAAAVTKMIDENDLDNAVLYASKGLNIDPISEELHSLIITALIRKGCKKLAINHFNNTLLMFDNEFSVKPTLNFKNNINRIINCV